MNTYTNKDYHIFYVVGNEGDLMFLALWACTVFYFVTSLVFKPETEARPSMR